MTEKLTTIKPPKKRAFDLTCTWPTDGLVQVGEPTETSRGTVQDVYLDGIKIGQVECITHTPFPRAAPGRAEKQWRMFPGTGRPSYDTRWEALRIIIRDHQESLG